MNEPRIACATAALAPIPEDYCAVTASEVAAQENGHSFHRALHIGWAWGVDESGREYLDLLWEHRHPGTHADRYFADGTTEGIAVPFRGYPMAEDPAENAERERWYLAENRRIYADLRGRGLLPDAGANVPSQDINEFLQTGGQVDGD
ncbi:hypothetical protein [Tomitella fengzijianii]|uniref:Uncharacterized protein n=1 Tax=Tomitella fengzijianii TaxID=2597660 RepID=A0A516X500_9ACTN|nr:hypothetical protein [Tomitella fengzijianii]QDQ98158.1 hypothetical protein FO059_13620 [Tomitella fengzijianii]